MNRRSRSPSTSEDDLRLPRLPGVFRRFWARHPVLADVLIAGVCLLLSIVPAGTFEARTEDAPGIAAWWPATSTVVVVVVAAGCLALLVRRRWPVAVFIAAVLVAHAYLLAPLPLGGPLLCIATYSLAVYRSVRACVVWAAVGLAMLAGVAVLAAAAGVIPWSIAWNALVGQAFMALVGGLIGANVGNRKRYVEALIERSRQLAVERDQQAQLAAASERERIARELHDIVAHSLTVMVALAEGVAASTDAERSRPGANAIAATGREALRDMRATLGVLRDVDDAPLAPLVRDTTAETVASARAGGWDAELTVIGEPGDVGTATLLAVSRIVQEGVTNAMRHARGARRIDVVVAYRPDAVEVSVTDDGDAGGAPAPPGGYGLQGLRERVALAGGTVSAGRRESRGWRVAATLPRGDDLPRATENDSPREKEKS